MVPVLKRYDGDAANDMAVQKLYGYNDALGWSLLIMTTAHKGHADYDTDSRAVIVIVSF